MKNQQMNFGCRWQVADVTRPLNAVSEVCGPMGETGVHDVLFNNNTCYVVPPGIVAKIMELSIRVKGTFTSLKSNCRVLRGRIQPSSPTATGTEQICKSHTTVCRLHRSDP